MKWKYLKKKYRYNPKRAFFFLFLFLFLGSFTIGYAFLTKELSIEGSSTLVGATWDIHFENIQVKSGSVTPTTAATITNPTSITFGVALENPGDFYEFNVDVVNDGTFDAMIESFSFLPVLTSAQQEYLEYSVKYLNNAELEINQRLDTGTQETLKVRFGYIDGLDSSLYPLQDQEIEIEVEIVYVQATDDAIDVTCSVTCSEGTYLPADSCECAPCEAGNSCPGGEYSSGDDPVGTVPCPAGEYSGAGASACTNCPAGSYSSGTGTTNCILCPAGSYQDEAGQSSCKVCATGKTSSAGSTSSCTTNCTNSSTYINSWVTPTWTGSAVSNSCTVNNCKAGSRKNSNACTACGKGTYTSAVNTSSSCTNCPAGSYQDATGQTVCKVCASGKTSSAGAQASCTTNCSNSTGVSTWNTPAWSNNSVSNHCSIASCTSGYSLNNGVCIKDIVVTFNYNKASWNTNTTRTCSPGSNGKCTVTAPGIAGLSGTTNNSYAKPLSQLFNYLGWSTSSTATSATYGPTASIEVSSDITYYAVVTVRSSVSIRTNSGNTGVNTRTGPGTNYPRCGAGQAIPENRTCTIVDYSYSGDEYIVWLKTNGANSCGYDDYLWFVGKWTYW